MDNKTTDSNVRLLRKYINQINNNLQAIDIEWILSIDSTNNELKRQWESGRIKSDKILVAEEQKAGKGQYGRSWFSQPKKSLTFSLLTTTKEPRENHIRLPLLYAKKALEALSPIIKEENKSIKEPNDIYINGKKVAGTLIECLNIQKASPPWIIIVGIGINISLKDFPHDLTEKSTSLSNHNDALPPREKILASIIHRFIEDNKG